MPQKQQQQVSRWALKSKQDLHIIVTFIEHNINTYQPDI